MTSTGSAPSATRCTRCPVPPAGIRLGPGAEIPPLLLDDEEAVAVVVGLRSAAGGAVAGIEESSVQALAKLEQVLPSRLRQRVNALGSVMNRFSPPAALSTRRCSSPWPPPPATRCGCGSDTAATTTCRASGR